MLHTAIETSAKSAEAFRTISEVATALDVPQHVLRFWESKFSQIRPVKRAGGRRYYRPEDVDLLRGIRSLLYGDGLTIKGAQKILRDQGLRYVAGIGRGEMTLVEPRKGKHMAPPPTPAPPPPAPEPEVLAAANKPKRSRKAAKQATSDQPDLLSLPQMKFEFLGLTLPEGAADAEAPVEADAPEDTPIAMEAVSIPVGEPESYEPALGPESRARLEIRLAELLSLKENLAAIRARLA